MPRESFPDAATLRARVEDLRHLFAARGARLRIELAVLRWPGLGAELEAIGLKPDEETPLLCCTPATFVPRPARRSTIGWVKDEDNLRFVAATMRQGFELRGGPPTDDEVAALAVSIAAGVDLAFARSEGLPAATGCSLPLGGTTELSAVSVLPNLRRRGIASELVSFLCAEHFARGGELAWACAPEAAAGALLFGLGWQDAGVRVSYLDH